MYTNNSKSVHCFIPAIQGGGGRLQIIMGDGNL